MKKRVELKLLQSDLAKILGVSSDSITYWENNRSKP
ncbi:helix-turn-helix domain-containing protein [Pedobacter suwonensis]|nr:helix-turn-helix domain-containing protein [Pedobacter suwonensis]